MTTQPDGAWRGRDGVSIQSVAPITARVEFEAWVRPHLAAMARLTSRLAPRADRDDIVQEALTRAWLKRDQYDERRGTPVAWLLAITADQARKAARRNVAGLIEFGGPTGVPAEDRLDLQAALTRLTRRQRLAVECFYFVGLPIAETAAVMGCSLGTVKSTLADARLRLRSVLEVAE
jgi:DNA-directed RNA polymerase specialized sigma24 family protein